MEKLKSMLQRIDGKGYKAYKDIVGSYTAEGYMLHIDHVQGDPFAAPSRIRLVVRGQRLRIDPEWRESPWRLIAAQDFINREISRAIGRQGGRSGGHGKSGLISIDRPGQQVLLRTAVLVHQEYIEVRLSVGLPAAGRSILGRAAIKLLCEQVPSLVLGALDGMDRRRLRTHLELADQQQAIRDFLAANHMVAFIADGAVLPRESGVSDRPLQGAVPFRSPDSLAVRIPVPHGNPVRGMAIPQGVTLIVGGGYHGKSTLLKAIERGVYNHAPGDGRELIITDETACKIRAEDGRRVEKVDISPFIANLPFGKDTWRFCSEDASGSTSQAANILEALELQARTLLIDEDTSATNFMIRDARMQELVAKEKEPITPFVDKVRQLYEEHGVSTILVLGGSGDYFSVADRVILMDEYTPVDVTKQAKDIARRVADGRVREGGQRFGNLSTRVILPDSFDASRGKRDKVDAKGLSTIVYGTHELDLSYVEQLIDPSQTRAIAFMMMMLNRGGADGKLSLDEVVSRIYKKVEDEGLDIVSPHHGKHPGDLALPRKLELAAAINRLRTLKVK